MSLFNWFRDEESFSNDIKRKGSNSLLKNYGSCSLWNVHIEGRLWPKQKLVSSLWHWQRRLWSFEPGSVTFDLPMALKELLRSGLYVEVLLGKFLIATIIIYYNLRGLKRHSFIILQFWRPEIWNHFHEDKIKVSAGLRSFWRSEGRSRFFSFSSF